MSTLKTHNLQSPDAGSVNIALTPNAGMVVAGVSTYSNQINVGSNIKLGTAGVVTATSFVGSGANLTSLPAQATIANNADNRVITGGSGVNLNGEANLIFDGSSLGINVTSPSYPLDVVGDGGGSFSASSNSTNGVLSVVGKNSSGSVSAISRIKSYPDGSSNQSHMAFETRNSSSQMVERLRIDSNGNMGLGTLLASDAGSAGAGLKIEKYVQRNNIYAFPDGYYGASLGEVQNTENKVWASIDSHYNRTSAVSAGIFLSAFHADAGGSGCGAAIKNLKAGNALTFSTVTTGASVGSVAVETERLRITSAGKLLIGSNIHNASIASGVGSQLQIEGNSYTTSSFTLINNQNSTDPAFINFGKSRAGSAGGTTIVQNGDRLGGIRWAGADGTDLHSRAASIDVTVNGTPAGNNMPGMMSFSTSPAGTHVPVDRLNIDAAGRVTLGAGTQGQYASAFNSGANQLLITSNGSTGLTIDSTSSTSSSIHFADGPTGSESYRGIIEYNHGEDDMKIAVAGTHIARFRKGSYSDVNGALTIGASTDISGDAHSDSRTLIIGGPTFGETGMTLLNSTSGSGKIRFSDGQSPFNQGAIAYYHPTRTVGSVPSYAESLSFVAAQKDDQFVLNGNEAMRLSSNNSKMKMVDGFWTKSINTSYQTVFTIQSGYDNSSLHRGYFYEIIVFGGDWGSHSANRVYFKGFINGYDGYGGHTVIEHSGTFGSNTGGQGHYGSDECQITVTFTSNGNSHIQMRLNTGSVTAEGYARFVGWIRDYDGFEIR